MNFDDEKNKLIRESIKNNACDEGLQDGLNSTNEKQLLAMKYKWRYWLLQRQIINHKEFYEISTQYLNDK